MIPGEAPIFLISGYQDKEDNRFTITFGKDRKSSVLYIRAVKPEDSAFPKRRQKSQRQSQQEKPKLVPAAPALKAVFLLPEKGAFEALCCQTMMALVQNLSVQAASTIQMIQHRERTDPDWQRQAGGEEDEQQLQPAGVDGSFCSCNIIQKDRQDVISGEHCNLGCDHAAIATNDYIHWYRMIPGEAPIFLISGYNNKEDNRFTITFGKDRKSSVLYIRAVKPEDSAVYLCAQGIWMPALSIFTCSSCGSVSSTDAQQRARTDYVIAPSDLSVTDRGRCRGSRTGARSSSLVFTIVEFGVRLFEGVDRPLLMHPMILFALAAAAWHWLLQMKKQQLIAEAMMTSDFTQTDGFTIQDLGKDEQQEKR
ncbi:unnamed protein product [Ranitomeya imitator]|uniref:Ig-like domain-containing protein n=1 Tax=Ranitomeya imitator TaxID=111125 RepID=A0ABN9KYG8_9NEOB|nr:unnamed protein product [Ranitomeya imitator]